jgi:hypothetical protein
MTQTLKLPVSELNASQPIISNDAAHQSAQYIADMLLELRNLAKAANQKSLQALLELSYYEAYTVANPVQIPQDEHQRLEDMAREAKLAGTI